MIYKWKPGSRLNALDANAAGETLTRLRTRNGQLTPEIVVNEAQAESSPLHDGFEWDDSVAAHEYRLHQARHIINCIVIFDEDVRDEPFRAFVSVVQNDHRVYQTTQIAMNDDEMRVQVLKDALAELNAIMLKYEDLEELSFVFDAIREVAA